MTIPIHGRLTEPRRRLVRLLRRLHFGKIENLRLVGGEPVFDARLRATREDKMDRGAGSHSGPDAADSRVKDHLAALFRLFDEIRDGTIDVLEVKHGLPFRALRTVPVPA